MSTRRWSAPGPRLFCALALLTSSGASRAAAEPCKLLTPAQVAAALGGTFGAGQPISTSGCSWTSDTPHGIVTVSLWPPAEWNRVKTSPLPGAKIVPASGLGDDAFYVTFSPYSVLYVKKGQTVFLFKVYGVKDHAKQMSAEKTLALDALATI